MERHFLLFGCAVKLLEGLASILVPKIGLKITTGGLSLPALYGWIPPTYYNSILLLGC